MMLQLNIDQSEFIVHTDSEYNSYVHPRLWSVAHSCVTLWFIVYTLHLNCDYRSRGGRTQLTFAEPIYQIPSGHYHTSQKLVRDFGGKKIFIIVSNLL